MTNENALAVAQRFISAVENRDSDAAIATLAEDVRQVFALSADGSEAHGPIFEGYDEVAWYVGSMLEKFSALRWPNARWTAASDGHTAFMEARGDAVVAHSNAPYHNTYAIRFDVENGLIKQITEYTNMDTYVRLGIPVTDRDILAVERGLAQAT